MASSTTSRPAPRLFTVTEYYQIYDAGVFDREERVELIEGQILVMYPRSVAHIWTVVRLSKIFFQHDDCIVSIQNPLRLAEHSEPMPDIAALHRNSPRGRHPSPKYTYIVVEVADVSMEYDLNVKTPLYARAGVPEYWIVDIQGERVEVYTEPSAAGYRNSRFYLRGESLSPAFAPDLTVAVDAILGPIEESDEADQEPDPA